MLGGSFMNDDLFIVVFRFYSFTYAVLAVFPPQSIDGEHYIIAALHILTNNNDPIII